MPDEDAVSLERCAFLRMERAHGRWRQFYNLKAAADQGFGRYQRRKVQVDRCLFLATARVLELAAVHQHLTGRASVPAEVLLFAARELKQAVRGFPSLAFVKRKSGRTPSEEVRAARAAAVEYLAMCDCGEIDFSDSQFRPEFYHKKTGALRPRLVVSKMFGVADRQLDYWKKVEERSSWRKAFRVGVSRLIAERGYSISATAYVMLSQHANLWRSRSQKQRE